MGFLKIVAVHNRYQERGGEDEVFEAEAQLLSDRGCTIKTVIEPASDPRTWKQKYDVALNCIWSKPSHEKFLNLLRQERPDVVHIHNFFPGISPSVYYACREAEVPVVQTIHNYRLICPSATLYRDGHICEECMDHSLWRGVRYGCYRESRLGTAAIALMIQTHRKRETWTDMVDCYVTLTEFARQKMIAGGLPADKITVKPNFMLKDPGKRTARGEYALFVGRLADLKGIPTMLAAWQRLDEMVPLVIAGDGPFRVEMESEIARRGLSHVLYRGRLSRQDTVDAMKNARFLVFPSGWYEGFPMTIVEAFACGLPVICSRLGSMQEIVTDSLTGWHFNSGDPDDLAAKINWAWKHAEETDAMGTAARREFETRYTATRNYEMLIEIYEKVMNACVCA
jgi:glycosyltransferase involved in cell wall biosynthesis